MTRAQSCCREKLFRGSRLGYRAIDRTVSVDGALDRRRAAFGPVVTESTAPSAPRVRSTVLTPPFGPTTVLSVNPSAPRVRSTVVVLPLAPVRVLSTAPSAPRLRSIVLVFPFGPVTLHRLCRRRRATDRPLLSALWTGSRLVDGTVGTTRAIDCRHAALRTDDRLVYCTIRAARTVNRRNAALRACDRLVDQAVAATRTVGRRNASARDRSRIYRQRHRRLACDRRSSHRRAGR